jgi:hypothetical protein
LVESVQRKVGVTELLLAELGAKYVNRVIASVDALVEERIWKEARTDPSCRRLRR